MAESYERFYPGTLSSLDYPAFQAADYGELFTGYRVPMSQVSMTTDPRTANVLNEVATKLSQGMGSMEVSQAGAPEIFESIPRQHFKELDRVGKLTGVDFSLHAPIIEPSGLTRDGWTDWSREEAERQFKHVIERAHEMSPKGNIPVTIHASQLPATEWVKGGGEERKAMMVAYDNESHQLMPLRHEIKYYPGEGEEGVEWKPEDRLKSANLTHWENNLTQMLYYKQRADDLLRQSWPTIAPLWKNITEGKVTRDQLSSGQLQAFNDVQNALIFYRDQIDLNFKEMYNEAYKYAPKEFETGKGTITDKDIRKNLKQIGDDWKRIQSPDITPSQLSAAYNEIIYKMKLGVPPPEHYVPIEKFAKENTSKTIANTALHGFMKYGENAPVVSVENVFPNTAFGRAEDLKGLVKEARKRFVEEAKKKGIGADSARSAAEKLIGATWDVGHINMLRKYGYDKADIVKETEKIAPFVKHVHISDNFGLEHIELPPGMGNVPMKEMLKELEKKGFTGKKIIEAGNWFQHFKTSPLAYVAEAFGSPLYGMMAAPYWNQFQGVQGRYMAGPLAYMPEQHFSIYGSGFSTLPTELGGNIPGKQSRFSGAPTE